MHQFFLSIRGYLILAATFSALLLVSGCGDSDSSDSTAKNAGEVTVETGSLSKAEFVRQVDRICKESRDQFNREFEAESELAGKELAEVSSKDQAKLASSIQAGIVNGIFVPNYEQLVDGVSSLGAPSGDEGQITAFLRAVQKALDKASAEPEKVFEKLTPFERAINLANAYGLTGCAKSFG